MQKTTAAMIAIMAASSPKANDDVTAFLGGTIGQERIYLNTSSFSVPFYSKEVATSDTTIEDKKYTTIIEVKCDSVGNAIDSVIRIKHIRSEGNRLYTINAIGSGIGYPYLFLRDTSFNVQGALFLYKYKAAIDSPRTSASVFISYSMDPNVITENHIEGIGLSSIYVLGLQGYYSKKTLVFVSEPSLQIAHKESQSKRARGRGYNILGRQIRSAHGNGLIDKIRTLWIAE